MCGIIGFLDKRGGERPLGLTLLAMLRALGCRGPDSAGVAVFGPPGEPRLRIRAPEGAGTDDVIAGLQPLGVAPYRHYRDGVIDALLAKGIDLAEAEQRVSH